MRDVGLGCGDGMWGWTMGLCYGAGIWGCGVCYGAGCCAMGHGVMLEFLERERIKLVSIGG